MLYSKASGYEDDIAAEVSPACVEVGTDIVSDSEYYCHWNKKIEVYYYYHGSTRWFDLGIMAKQGSRIYGASLLRW